MDIKNFLTLIAMALCVFAAPLTVSADSLERPTNQVHLSASAEREVPNELFRISMFTELRDADPAKIADEINSQMSRAVAQAKAVDGVTVKTGSYNTTPIYNYKSPSREPVWQGTQELVLESKDLQGVLKLAGSLQQFLKIRNVSYAVTPKTRQQIQDELIEEAMQAFHQRAAVVGRHMPKTDYEIGEIHINVGGSRPPMYRHNVRAAASPKMMEADGGPAVEAGTTRLEVSVSGSVRY